jgi:hypothetical protein
MKQSSQKKSKGVDKSGHKNKSEDKEMNESKLEENSEFRSKWQRIRAQEARLLPTNQ